MLIPATVRLVYCYFGNGIALGAYGPRGEIDSVLNALYNYKGHSDETNRFLSDSFAYVATDKRRLLYGLTNWLVTQKIAEKVSEPREARRGVWEKSEEEAKAILESIEHETFLTEGPPVKEYSIPQYESGKESTF